MNLKDLEQVNDLRDELMRAEDVLRAFQSEPGPTIGVRAYAGMGTRGREWVELLPVEKSVAVSAARREREKIVSELRQLGVTVD